MLWILASLLGCNGDKDEDDSNGNGNGGDGDDSSPIGVDDDGDGYETPDDCDDADENVNPGAAEVCDGIDNDCDTLIDDGDDNFEGGVAVYTDSDGDDYGDDATERQACDASGVGVSDQGGDCNDADSQVNPEALELCDDDIDSNCDTTEVGCIGTTDSSYAIWDGEAAGDLTGLDVAARGDLDGDDIPDVIVGARENDAHGDNAGAAFVLFGPLQSVESTFKSADAELYSSQAGARGGKSIEFVGDVGGDKGDDVAVSASIYTGTSGPQAGRVYFVDAAAITAGSTQDLEKVAWASLSGGAQYDYSGSNIERGGDVDGNGTDDVWVGIPGDDDAGSDGGSIVLVAGPVTGTSLDAQAAKLVPEAAGHLIGGAMAAGDYNGDGNRDLAVGDAVEDATGSAGGAVYVVYGSVSGLVSLADADVKIVSNEAGDTLGTSIANAGDTNSDGLDDLLVGAPYSTANVSGEAVLIESPLKSGAVSAVTVATFVDADANDRVGRSVAGNNDVDGDTVVDFLIGAPGWGGAKGATYLVGGPVDGLVDLSAQSLRWWVGVDTQQVGENVAFGGPALEGGGEAILLPSPYSDDNGIDAGALYVQD